MNYIKENLENKAKLLDKIIEIFSSMEQLSLEEESGVGIFDSAMDEAGTYFDKLIELDDGLASYIEKLDPAKITDAATLRSLNDDVMQKQKQISQMVDVLQKKTDQFFNSRKSDLGNQKRSVAGIKGYFKSMGGLREDSSYLDNKI